MGGAAAKGRGEPSAFETHTLECELPPDVHFPSTHASVELGATGWRERRTEGSYVLYYSPVSIPPLAWQHVPNMVRVPLIGSLLRQRKVASLRTRLRTSGELATIGGSGGAAVAVSRRRVSPNGGSEGGRGR